MREDQVLEMVLSVWSIVSGVLMLYYWVDYHTRGGVQVLEEEWCTKFQDAFPTADIWTAACCLTAGVGILTGRTYGLVFALLAASSLLFLALMDITFNVQNNLYRLLKSSNPMKTELVINIWALSLGIILIAYSWPRVL